MNIIGTIEKLNKKYFECKTTSNKKFQINYNGHTFEHIKLYDIINCEINDFDDEHHLMNINYVTVGNSKKSIIMSFLRCGSGCIYPLNYKISNKLYNSLCKEYSFSLKPKDSLSFNKHLNYMIEKKDKEDLYLWFNLGIEKPSSFFWKLEKDRIDRQLVQWNVNVDIVKFLSREKYKILEKIKDNPFKICVLPKNIKYELCDKLKIHNKLKIFEDVDIFKKMKMLSKLSRFLYKLYVEGYYYVEKSIIENNFILPNENTLYEFDIVYDLDCYYSIEAFNIENEISEFIKSRLLSENYDTFFLSKICKLNNKYDISSNYNVFISIFEENILQITGKPGCGKTTLIKKLITIFIEYNISYLVVSFTGKATDQIRREFKDTNTEIYTLHGALHRNNYNFKYLILDEASMISTKLFYQFIKKFNHNYKIIFVGDLDQLPCIDGISILKVLSKCENVPKVILDKNYRHDKETQRIFKNMLNYHTTQEKIKFNSKVKLISNNVSINEVIRQYHKVVNKNCMYNVKILSPYKKCVKSINSKIRDYYSFSGSGGSNSENDIQTCDYIIFIKNDYEQCVFNGQEGIILNKDKDTGLCHVLIDQNVRIFDIDYLKNHVNFSYCITISKSQGDEWDIVIVYIPTVDDKRGFLIRNRLYTAMSRCIKKVIVICDESKFYNILNNLEKEKCTNIPKRLYPLRGEVVRCIGTTSKF